MYVKFLVNEGMKINANIPNDLWVNTEGSAPVSKWNFFLTRRNHAGDSYTAAGIQASGAASGAQAPGYPRPLADVEETY